MRLSTILFAVLTAAAAAPANAVVCYTLMDRNDTLLYRGSLPPVDMSDKGAAQREALRRNHEYLMVLEVDQCQPVAAAAGTTGYRPATVDEIVAQMRDYLSFGGVSSGPGVSGGGGVAPASGGGSSPALGRY